MVGHFGWFVGLLVIGFGLGATVIWVRMNEQIVCLHRAFGKCDVERRQLLTAVSALDDELDSLEAEVGSLREHVLVCDSCMLEIPRTMPFETVFCGKNSPMYKCDGCGRMEDRESLSRDFPELDLAADDLSN